MSDYMLCSPSHFLPAGAICVELSLSQLCHPKLIHPITIIIMYIYLLLDYMPGLFVCRNNIIVIS